MNVVLIVLISVSFGGLFIYMVVIGAIKVINELAKRFMDYRLKMKLIERGYSVSEIERVLERDLGPGEIELKKAARKPVPPTKN